MPVRKFHSVDDMTPAVVSRPFAPENLRLAIALSRTCLALDRSKLRPGVYKHRSVEEAGEARRRRERG